MYSAIIPCAGNGARLSAQKNKLLYIVDNKTIIEYTIKNFIEDDDFTEVILVVKESEWMEFSKFSSKKIKLVTGGDSRQESVRNGLYAATNKYVFVHDGARPDLSKKIINSCKKEIEDNTFLVVAIEVSDSMVDYNSNVFELVDREHKYLIQTPQCGEKDTLLHASEMAKRDGFIGNDESSLISKYTNTQIKLVEGSRFNIKITYPEDFDLFKRIKE